MEASPIAPARELDDAQMGQRLMAIAEKLIEGGPEAMVGVTALLREIEDRSPGTVEQMASRIQLARLGLSAASH